jgi:pyruvate-ferredoxin/flavodoxin oxidoreductase
MSFSLDQMKLAVDSGYWPLYRFDPRRIPTGETPLVMDSTSIKASLAQFMRNEARFRMVEQQNPERFRMLLQKAERDVRQRFAIYENLARITMTKAGVTPPAAPAPTAPAAPKA